MTLNRFEQDPSSHTDMEKGDSEVAVSEWPEARRFYGKKASALESFAKENPLLYHGTNIGGARQILERGTVGEMQLSFTPDYSVAKSYADAKGGKVFSISTRDIDPRWLGDSLERRERYPDLIKGAPVIQVGQPILGEDPRVIKAEVVDEHE
jgi:hypothetical protein